MGALARAFASPAALGAIALLWLGFAVQASVEEIVFRGWMLSAIAAKLGVATAIVLTSAVFTLLHFEPDGTLVFDANVVLFAVFACLWAIGSGNVWGIMGWHAAWNWIFAVGFELRVTSLDAHLPALLVQMAPRGPDYLTGGTQGPEGSVICSLLLVCAIVVAGARALRRVPQREPIAQVRQS